MPDGAENSSGANLTFEDQLKIIDQAHRSKQFTTTAAGLKSFATGLESGTVRAIQSAIGQLGGSSAVADALAMRANVHRDVAQSMADRANLIADRLGELTSHTALTWADMDALRKDFANDKSWQSYGYGSVTALWDPQWLEHSYASRAWDDCMGPWDQHVSDVMREVWHSSQDEHGTPLPMPTLDRADPNGKSPFDSPESGSQLAGSLDATAHHPAPGGSPADPTKSPAGPMSNAANSPSSPSPNANSPSSPGGGSSGGSDSGMSGPPGGSPPDLNGLSTAGTPALSHLPSPVDRLSTLSPGVTPVRTPSSLSPIPIASVFDTATPSASIPSLRSGSSTSGIPSTGVAARQVSTEPVLSQTTLAGSAASRQQPTGPMGPMGPMPPMGGMGGMGAQGAGGAGVKPGVAQQPGAPGLGGAGAQGAKKPKRLGVRPELAGRTDRTGQAAVRPAPSSRKRPKADAGREVLDEELWSVHEEQPSPSATQVSGRR